MSPDIHRAVALRQYLKMETIRTSPSSPLRFNGAMGFCFNAIMNEHPTSSPIRNLNESFDDVAEDKAELKIEEKYNHLSKEYVRLTEANMKMSDRTASLETELRKLRMKVVLERLKRIQRTQNMRHDLDKKLSAMEEKYTHLSEEYVKLTEKNVKMSDKRKIIESEVESYEFEWMRDVFRPRSTSKDVEKEGEKKRNSHVYTLDLSEEESSVDEEEDAALNFPSYDEEDDSDNQGEEKTISSGCATLKEHVSTFPSESCESQNTAEMPS
jgi:hypothetical protein